MPSLPNYLSRPQNRQSLMTALGAFCVVGATLVSAILVHARFFH